MATKSLLEAFGYTKPQSRKLNARQLRSLILTEARGLSEKADPEEMEDSRFPMKLSDVAADAEQAKANVKLGGEEYDADAVDDVIGVKPGSPSVKDVKPSQTSMNMPKAMAFALGHIKSGKPGGPLGAFISNDGHIMDGHHRWISSAMVDIGATLGGSIVDFPATKLIAVLNALTVGEFGEMSGKKASGGFEQFQGETGVAKMEEVLDDYLTNGSGEGEFRIEPEEVQTLLEKFSEAEGDEAKDAAIEKFAANLAQLDFTLPANAPERPDMPVIEKGNNQAAVTALETGQVDVNPPYGEVGEGGEGDEEKKANESVWPVRRDDLVLERWQKLAGLLKD